VVHSEHGKSGTVTLCVVAVFDVNNPSMTKQLDTLKLSKENVPDVHVYPKNATMRMMNATTMNVTIMALEAFAVDSSIML